MRVLVVSEGDHESDALTALIDRVVGDSVDSVYEKFRDKKVMTTPGKGGKLFKRVLAWVRFAERQSFDAVAVVVDEDGSSERRRQVHGAGNDETLPIRKAIGLAIREFEAWVLADEKAISEACGKAVQKQPNPEQIKDAKQHYGTKINAFFDNGMSRREQYAEIIKKANLDVVSARCPVGFSPFLVALQNFSAKR